MATTNMNSAPKSASQRKRNRPSSKKVAPSTAADDAAPPTANDGSLKTQCEDQSGDKAATNAADSLDDTPICWICAEPVIFWAVSQCDHRTCHVCALRLRALYKRMDCTFCKEPQPTVVFTSSPDKSFSTHAPNDIPFTDSKLAISFETQEMMEETLILLRFNCPDPSCDFIAGGWNDLKMHVRATHGKQMCDLCIKFKKVFAHEHHLYTHAQLAQHLPSYGRRPLPSGLPNRGKESKDKIEGGIHPFCDFCKESFFGGDELFSHMREAHEECFVCKRAGIRDQHFENYASLERHFTQAHYPCLNANCQAQKFVVFASKLDLQGHMIEVHQEGMSTRDKKEARRIVEGVEFEQLSRGGAHRHTQATQPARNSRREAFGAQLSTPAFPALPSTRNNNSIESDTSTREPGTYLLFEISSPDQVTLDRHRALHTRLTSLTSNSPTAIASVKSAIRSYLASESGPRDLISTIFTVVRQELEPSASIMNGLVDLFDDEEKKKALLGAWNGFKLEYQREFPDLVPGGSETAKSRISSGRVLNAKQSTVPRIATQSATTVHDRVANIASSSAVQRDNFPALTNSSTKSNQRSVAASTSTWKPPPSQSQAPPRPFSVPGSASQTKGRGAAPKLSHDLFPSLPPPSSTTAIEVRQLVNGERNRKLQSVSKWGSGQPSSAPVTPGESENESTDPPVSKGRKKKGKEKQTLFTLGTFPT